MDIDLIAEQLKARNDRVTTPVRIRRKRPQKRPRRLAADRRYLCSEKGHKAARTYRRSFKGSLNSMRRVYRQRGIEWRISLEEWIGLWKLAGWVENDIGIKMPAYRLRGRGYDDVRIMRRYPEKGWVIENVLVLWKGKILAKGWEVIAETSTSDASLES